MPNIPVTIAPRTELRGIQDDRSRTGCWPMFTQPASCAVRSVLSTSPAAIRTRKTPEMRKNRPMLRRTPPE